MPSLVVEERSDDGAGRSVELGVDVAASCVPVEIAEPLVDEDGLEA